MSPNKIQEVNFQSPSSDYVDNISLEKIENSDSEIVLSIMWSHGKIASAYYHLDQKMLYTVLETIDKEPKFQVTQALIREMSPKRIIAIGKMTDGFIQALIGFVRNNASRDANCDKFITLPANMTLLDFKEFSYNACLYSLKIMHLQSLPPDNEIDQSDRLSYIQTLVNIDSTASMHILGALIKFLEQAWHNMRASSDDSLIFLHIKQITVADHVFMDNSSFNALNIFNQMKHDSTFKHGGASSSREGTSLFRLLSLHCISTLGTQKLRDILQTPIKNVDELNKRYDFMDFIRDPRNDPVSTMITNGLKKIVNVHKILLGFKRSQGNLGHWKALYNTLLVMLRLNEELQPFVDSCSLFRSYHDSITDNLYNLEGCVSATLDFDVSPSRNRPLVKMNIDQELDEGRSKYDAITNRLVAAARIMINQLPLHMDECTVAYVPDMGHMLSVRRWSDKCQADSLQEYGCYFLFEINNVFYYTNALCQELDKQLGDLPSMIHEQENRIIQRVASFAIYQNQHFINPLEILAYMDALITMAKVGSDRNYIRPEFNAHNILEIKDGRHPLVEIAVNGSYVANDYASGGSQHHRPMKIITGPNASGKSMYLKQTALLVYMAHIGSYLPAASANISVVHSIHSRLHSTESAALNMSAFVMDVLQMGNALYNAKSSSLVIMDEFGRGTTGHVSQALFLGALRHFLFSHEVCPHVLVATHLTLQKEFIDSPLVHYQTMSYMKPVDSEPITFLYKIIDGESPSFTFELSLTSGLPRSVIDKAKEIVLSLNGQHVEFPTEEEERNFFLNVQLPPFDD